MELTGPKKRAAGPDQQTRSWGWGHAEGIWPRSQPDPGLMATPCPSHLIQGVSSLHHWLPGEKQESEYSNLPFYTASFKRLLLKAPAVGGRSRRARQPAQLPEGSPCAMARGHPARTSPAAAMPKRRLAPAKGAQQRGSPRGDWRGCLLNLLSQKWK